MSKVDWKKIVVLGAGKMGTTLVHALIADEVYTPDQILATGRRQDVLDLLAESEGVRTGTDNIAAVAEADMVLLCVKPQAVSEVLDEIAPALDGQVIISIAAGATTRQIEDRISGEPGVVRAMPNTPSLIGAGMTALCGGRWATEAQIDAARRIFDSMGRTVVLDESYFDAVTGLSASGPAFVYIIIESLAEGGVKVGLPRKVATELAAQACVGAARMVLETGNPPALLKDDVTTPAGCTMDGILKLEEGGLRVTLIKAIVEATRRAGELA